MQMCSYDPDPDLDLMTLILYPDLNALKIYLHANNEDCKSGHSELEAEQGTLL